MAGLDFIKKISLEIEKENLKGANSIVLYTLTNLLKAIQAFSDADLISQIEQSCILLFRSQPIIAPLANCLALILDSLDAISRQVSHPDSIKTKITAKINTLLTELQSSNEKIASNATPLIRHDARILTYSFSSTVFETIKFQKELKKRLSLFITEARPNYEGVIGAQQFSKIFPTTLFIDAGVGTILQDNSVNLVLIGADAINSMYLIHKIGTLPLAITASELGIPVYVLSHSLKFQHSDTMNITLPIELKSKYEITPEEIEDVDIRNYYFDRTPLKYLTGIITEERIYDLKNDQLPIGVDFPTTALKKLYSSFQDRKD